MKINTNQNEIFETTDLSLVATITINNFQVESINKTDTHRVKFVFRKSERLTKIIQDFWDGKMTVEPKKFFQELKIIKTRIYSNE